MARAMANLSPRALAVLYGFSVLFLCCPQLLGAATEALASPWGLGRLAATVIFPAFLLTLVVTPLLAFAHVGAIGGAGAAGDDPHLATGLAKLTVLAATVALLAGAVLLLGADGIVVQIGADGHLDRGRGDVARLNIK